MHFSSSLAGELAVIFVEKPKEAPSSSVIIACIFNGWIIKIWISKHMSKVQLEVKQQIIQAVYKIITNTHKHTLSFTPNHK